MRFKDAALHFVINSFQERNESKTARAKNSGLFWDALYNRGKGHLVFGPGVYRITGRAFLADMPRIAMRHA